MSARMSARARALAVALAVFSLVIWVPRVEAQTAPATFKVAWLNIKSGKGQPSLSGFPSTFSDTTNCTDTTQPLNAWGVGLVQNHLRNEIGADPSIVALGLAESWATVCGSPKNVQAALGWAAHSSERNGVALVARYGFADAEEWVQLDTSLNTNPNDTAWVLRVPVCLNAACTQSMNVFAAHWYADNTYSSTTYSNQGQQTVAFLGRAAGSVPHVFVGDLNVWEGLPTCSQNPISAGLSFLRDVGYIDAWPALHGTVEGFTGMANRAGCGVPQGYTWKRIDYAWSPSFFPPLSITRWGLETPGYGTPSDHYGLIAEYPWPGSTQGPDTTPPAVSISSPANGATVSGTVTISAVATDNVGVTKVEILEDGAVAQTVTAAPYQTSWDTTKATQGAHTVCARAYDAAGNVGASTTTSVTVQQLTVSSTEIVLYAKNATKISGNWIVTGDAQAAGGARVWNPDAGLAKLSAPLASPADYFELTFNAQAGTAYHLWLRGIAQNDDYANDSVFVQFSGSVDQSGAAIWRIGTTDSATVILEDCSGCGLAGWGWQDNGWGGALGPEVRFATSGPQTIRIQRREDGFSIDQIVLSAQTYLTQSPGLLKLDTTILTGTPTVSASEVVIYAASVKTVAGFWRVEQDSTAANRIVIHHPDAGAPKVLTPLASPANYAEFTFNAEAGRMYHMWLRGRADNDDWANDSVYVQFSNSVDAAGAPVLRIGSTSAATVNIEDCSGCGLSGWGWQDNGYGVGVMGPNVTFNTTGPQTIRIQTREDGLRIDQIVLSSQTYLTVAPGALKNDTTIVH